MLQWYQNKNGFTLMEMIIVIIIMGVLAAVIIPQISNTTEESKLTNLKANLNTLRKAVELYYIQHNSTYPGDRKQNGDVAATDMEAMTSMVLQLTRYTDKDGKVSAVKTDEFNLGPYIKNGVMLTNPFNNKKSVTCDVTTTDITVRASDGLTGWKFYTKTGVLIANDGAHDDV